MAGGEGSRLRPLTANRPKPLVPVGSIPIMEHIVRHLAKQGFSKQLSTLSYLGDEIQSYFADGSDFGVEMRYSVEPVPLGTAGSVKKAEDYLNDEAFLIVSGDALTDCNFKAAVEFHRQKGAAATLILYRVPNPLEFGLVISDSDGKITRFLEKPSWSEIFSDTVNTGMYIIEPSVFDLMEQNQAYDWSGDIFPRMLELGLPLYGYVMDGFWSDVGSLQQYREAQEQLLSGSVLLEVPGETKESGIYLGPNCSIEEGAQLIPPVVLGRNVKVKKGAKIGPHSAIGDNCLIEEGAHIERSVVWERTYVGPYVSTKSSIICSRVTIKRECQLMEDSVIGDRCLLDVGTHVRPRVKLWPDKIVERGSTVTMSLVWGNKWRGNLFRDLGVAGLSNIEITPDFACRLGSAFGSLFPNGSQVVTSRDSSRTSRMLKRAVISSLLSVGCNVLDLRSAPVPVARHFIKSSGSVGAISVRKLPGNNRVSLIEMFGPDGTYLSKNTERKVETLFFREDFKRTDPDDVGIIEFSSRAVEEYQSDFFKHLGPISNSKSMRVVCDYGYSALSGIYPAMLGTLGIESISLNAFNDARRAPRSDQEIETHLLDLSKIVGTLGYDLGVLFLDEGERLAIVDGNGRLVSGYDLFAVICSLVVQSQSGATIAMGVTAPTLLEQELLSLGANVIRTKHDVRSLTQTAQERNVTFAGDERGGFVFPSLHPGFDAPFSFSKLLSMLQTSQVSIAEVVDRLPKFHLAADSVRVPWESKGTVMRRLNTEKSAGATLDSLDGVKFSWPTQSVVVLPDTLEPVFHVHGEASSDEEARRLVSEFSRRIESMIETDA